MMISNSTSTLVLFVSSSIILYLWHNNSRSCIRKSYNEANNDDEIEKVEDKIYRAEAEIEKEEEIACVNKNDNGLEVEVEGEVNAVSFQPFPWEPKSDDKDRLQKHIKTGLLNGANTYHEQIQFMASMTFANGGIRQPNCPCCV